MTEKQNETALVSLVIVNFNAGDLLSNCVESILGYVKEIIVVDNASTDNSLFLLQSRFSNESHLQVVQNDENLGFSAACNIGTKFSNSPNILFLNPDCVVFPDTVNLLLEVLDSNSDVGMVGGLLENPDGSEQAGSRRAVPTPWRSFVRAFGLHRFSHRWPSLFFDFHLHKHPLPTEPIAVEALSGACMLIKREALNDAGLWDESYFLHCEDLDLCMRFRQKGWKIMFVPGARLIHFLGKCSENCPIFVEWHKHKGMIHFYRKFFKHQYPGFLMWLVIVGVWLRFVLVASMKAFKRVLKAMTDK